MNTTTKIILGIAALGTVGIGGYFTYKYFKRIKNAEIDILEHNTKQNAELDFAKKIADGIVLKFNKEYTEKNKNKTLDYPLLEELKNKYSEEFKNIVGKNYIIQGNWRKDYHVVRVNTLN